MLDVADIPAAAALSLGLDLARDQSAAVDVIEGGAVVVVAVAA